MKKFLVTLFIFFLSTTASKSDVLEDFNGVDRMWDMQKPVSNQDYDKVINALEEQKNKKEEKKKKKKRKKISGGGTSLHEELNPDISIPEIEPLKPKEEGQLINIPVDLKLNGEILEKGFYKVIAQKENNKIYILFFQSQYYKGKVEATATEDDYGEKELDFVRLLPYNDDFVKIIFGSIDFNAYTFVPYINEKY